MSPRQVELDPELVGLLHQMDRPVEQTVRELIVLELYRRSVISSGKAAELLAMQRVAFIQYASKLGIPYFDMTKEELDDERRELRKL
jgi:predicted HTH domain antitoxin